jgi:hypothetical protein
MDYKNKKFGFMSLSSTLLITVIFFGSSAFALAAAPASTPTSQSSQSSSQTLVITPFIFQESLQKGQSISRDIQLHNNSNSPLSVSIETSNFVSGEKDGEPLFTGGDNQEPTKYSLSSWMTITTPTNINIAPGADATTTVKINIPQDAEDGGHYGGVLFSYSGPVDPNLSSQIITKTATLFFVSLGKANEQGALTNFTSSSKVYSNQNINFNATFADSGNVHLAPKGIIDVYNIWGKLVAAVQVNRDAQLLLPQTTRTFKSSWSDPWSFGFYHATLTMYYGTNNYEARGSTTFWILPIKKIIITLLLFALILLAAWWGIKRYNKYIIDKAQK